MFPLPSKTHMGFIQSSGVLSSACCLVGIGTYRTSMVLNGKNYTGPLDSNNFCEFCCVFVRGNVSGPFGGQFQFEYLEHEGNL